MFHLLQQLWFPGVSLDTDTELCGSSSHASDSDESTSMCSIHLSLVELNLMVPLSHPVLVQMMMT